MALLSRQKGKKTTEYEIRWGIHCGQHGDYGTPTRYEICAYVAASAVGSEQPVIFISFIS